METSASKVFLTLLVFFAVIWLGASAMKNYHGGSLLTFGTVEFRPSLDRETEERTYRLLAEYSVLTLSIYPFLLLSAAGYLRTTRRSMKQQGWLLMSAILLFLFVPLELYCGWLDWKLIGLHYWGEWPLEEFRKAFLARVTALAGLPLIAQLCYWTIPVILWMKPFQHKSA